MNIIGSLFVTFLLVVLISDFNAWVLKGGEKVKENAQKVNVMDTDIAKIIVIAFVGWLTVSLGVFFAGIYLWIASMGIASFVGVFLAFLNMAYLLHNIGWFIQIKLPESFPIWWRWAVAFEVVLGVPYLLYALYTLIGG